MQPEKNPSFSKTEYSAQAGETDLTHLATFEQYRGLLFSVAYRMLGSVADTEDMLQETFIRWHRSSAEEIRSPRAFLVTIISRLCINHLQSARVQREEYVGQWLPEPLVADPASDPLEIFRVDESLSMAFLLMLERLTPVERAVFLLREVFSYPYAEIAATVGESVANCRQILRRARQHVGTARQRFRPSAQARDEMLERFVRAARAGDLKGLVSLLSRDIVLRTDGGGKAIALPNVITGADKVARTVVHSLTKLLPKDLVARTVQINGEPGLLSYHHGKPFAAIILHLGGRRVQAIFIVTNPEKLAHLPGLPPTGG